MKGIWLTLPVIIWAIPDAADAQAEETSVVTLSVGSERNDPELIRTARPLDGFRDWLSPSDFPGEAFEGRYGRGISIDVVVNADDTIASCSSKTTIAELAPLADRACALVLERGRFRHALDADGRPSRGTVSMYASLARFLPGQSRVPPPAPPPPPYANRRPVLLDDNLLKLRQDPSLFPNAQPTAWLEISDKGVVTRCRILASSGTDAGDASICRQLLSARFEPGRDPRGKPIETTLHFVRLEVAP